MSSSSTGSKPEHDGTGEDTTQDTTTDSSDNSTENDENTGLLTSFRDWFTSLFDKLGNIAKSITEIPKLIIDSIERIFIPNTDNIQSSIDSLKNTFTVTFGIDSFDLSNVLGTSAELSDHTATIKYGNHTYSGVVFDVNYIVKAVSTFRPFIRGFLVLLMVIYNINQILNFIGAGSITFGSNSKTEKEEI